jgi:Rieske 2Fe-2S family protein
VATISEADRQRLVPALERSWYVDPAVFTAEQERIFARRWILVGRSSELGETGAYLTAAVGGESVIVVRQPDGTVAGLLNVCRHRGARILLDERGVCRQTITCPYHAWSYGLDGSLKGAPRLRDWVGASQGSLGLQAVAVHEEFGCLWVNLELGGESFADDVGAQVSRRLGDDARIDAWELDRLVTGRQIVYTVAANWKLIVENFMECYHCSAIHPELVQVIPEFRAGVASQSAGPGHGSAMGERIAGFTVDGRPGVAPLSRVTPEDQRLYFGMTITPSAFINLLGDHAIVHRLEPVAVDCTRVVCEWLFSPESLAEEPDIGPTVELFDRVNRQDFDACERCQLGAASRVYAHENVLVPLEHHLLAFYDEVRAAVED